MQRTFAPFICSLALAATVAAPNLAMSQGVQSSASPPASGAVDRPPLKPEELEQILAPVALYPDSLLSQVLMASTYPVEIVMADRWRQANSTLTGDALGKALAEQTWDPSVRSLVNVPQVLTMMSEKIDWTVKLGDAFLDNEKAVMDTVQKLRAKANAAGNLKTTPEQTVVVEPGPTQIITIQSPSPQVIYVPTYNPTVVYGTWAYPAYPPYYYYPPGYTAGAMALSFGVGVACGMAWGYAWGGCNWHNGNVNVNVNRNTNINNTNINRNNWNNSLNKGNNSFQNGQGNWQHDASHRGGVAYRDNATARQYGGMSSGQASQARDAYRGRTDGGANGANGARPGTGAGAGNAGAGNRPGGDGNRAGAGASTRPAGEGNRAGNGAGAGAGTSRPSSGDRSASGSRPESRQSSAFNGSSSSGRSASASSSRGSASRGGGGGGGGSRGGGGGRR